MATPNFAQRMHEASVAMSARDYPRALALLSDAGRLNPRSPDVHFNRAVALRNQNEIMAAIAALDAALALEPYHLPSHLMKGGMLEDLGLTREAAGVYRNALAFSPEPSRLPPPLAKAHERAVSCVRADSAALRDAMIAKINAVHSKYGKSETKRFDECLQIFTGHGRSYQSQPTMLYFPALPAVSYFDRDLFPWIEAYEAATSDIQRELEELLASPAADDFSPYINYPPGAPVNQWGELNHSRRWSTYFFWKDSSKNEDAFARAPKTGAAIDRLPLFDAPDFGPAAFFSSLAARSHIPPHVGSSNVRSIVHLPLVLPGPAWFRVGNETRNWRIGEAFVFDDSVEHEAMNEADLTRTILIVDVWNPYLTEPERELVSILLPESRRYKRRED
jgi:aspartyl/asparaginyl beta-hydroxylase (cupin superfamily)